MKLQRLTLSGITVFREPYTLDLAGRGRLVALVGRNGAGKSTLLEAVPAALFKGFPSRPASIYDYAHGRDAFIEALFLNHGYNRVAVRLAINAEARTMESYLTIDDVPMTTGRAAEYAAEVERFFGSEALLLASVFACQTKAGSFMYLPKAQRKALLVEMLGLGRLEELAELARREAIGAGAVAGELEDAGAKLDGLQAAIEDTDALLKAAGVAEEQAADDLRAAQEKLEHARRSLSEAEAQDAGDVEKLKAFTTLQDAYCDALGRHRAAVAAHERRGGELMQAKARAERAVKDAEADYYTRAIVIEERIAKWRALADRLPEIKAAADEVAAYSLEKIAIDAAMAEQRQKVATADAEARRTALDRQHASDKVVELERRAALLSQAACAAAPIWEPADPFTGRVALPSVCVLISDAQAAKAEIGAAVERRLEATLAQGDAALAHGEALRLLNHFVVPREPAKETRQTAALLESAKVAGDNLASSQADLFSLRLLERFRMPLLRRSAEDDAQAVGLWRAEALPEEPKAPVRPHVPDSQAPFYRQQVADADAEVKAIERRGGEASSQQARLDERLRELRSKLADAEKDAARLTEARVDLTEWELLAQALGKDGAQALEIDAAGPAIAGVCNELLQACFDARFAISFETLKEKRSKPGEFTETFDIRVLDRGEERMVEALSGGEKVVVGEALSLAIAITNARKNSIRWSTLFRDETAGALDPVAAAEYLNLLRKAMDFGGFEQCLFVAHQEQLWQAADSTVML